MEKCVPPYFVKVPANAKQQEDIKKDALMLFNVKNKTHVHFNNNKNIHTQQ